MAKGLDCSQVSRIIVLVINFVFLLLGIAMLVVGIIGLNKVVNQTKQADVLQDFDLPKIMIVILASGCGTIATSLFGFFGAYFRVENMLKIYGITLFIVICIQIGMGAYIMNLNIDVLEKTWAQEDNVGWKRRVDYQNYLSCCGWQTWYDSMGQLATLCPANLMPSITMPNAVPTTCRQATLDFIKDNMVSAAIAAVVIAVIEILALIATVFVIFDGKRRGVETGFEY